VKAVKAMPYPRGTVFGDDGVIIPPSDGGASVDAEMRFDDDGNLITDGPTRASIELDRLAASRHTCPDLDIRRAFYPLIVEAMKRCPLGRYFVFDHTHHGSTWFRAGDGAYVENVAPHSLGESETAMMWWLANMRGPPPDLPPLDGWIAPTDARLFTVDSDTIPLYLSYHDRFTSAATAVAGLTSFRCAFWHAAKAYDDSEVFDLPRMARDSVAYFGAGVSARKIAMAFMLTGDDYLKKWWYAHWIGTEDIIAAACATPTYDKETSHAFVLAFLRKMYTQKLRPDVVAAGGSDMDMSQIRKELASSKRMFPPSDETIAFLVQALQFDFMYRLHASDGTPPPPMPTLKAPAPREKKPPAVKRARKDDTPAAAKRARKG
jgi:hypothetical protein